MEYGIKKDLFKLNEVFFDGCQEQAVDLDFNLPDYCTDIQKILKCQIYPQITSRNISSDRLDVEGTAVARLFYLDTDKKGIRCYEQSSPFSCSFTLKGVPENPIVFTNLKVEYVNCRAVSPRRLDIHGAFSVCAKVICRTEEEIISNINADDMQQKKLSIPISDSVGLFQQQFSISEVLEVSSTKPSIESIVRTDVSAYINDYKVVSNKLILKGEVYIKVVYMSDMNTGQMEIMEYSIPISQIIDAEGIDDNCICDINLDIINKDIQVRSDTSGKNNLLDLDLRLSVAVKVYESLQTDLITDVYSTQYELNVSNRQMSFINVLDFITYSEVIKNNIDLSNEEVSKIIDVWNEILSINAKQEDDQIIFVGKMNLCLLALNNEDTAFYIEKMMDFECPCDWAGKPKNISCDARASITNISYRIINPNEVEIKAELKLSAVIYEKSEYKFITDVSAEEEIQKNDEDQVALTIYYAQPGESIWNIARNYNTSVEAIKRENDLKDDILESRGMILIPM